MGVGLFVASPNGGQLTEGPELESEPEIHIDPYDRH